MPRFSSTSGPSPRRWGTAFLNRIGWGRTRFPRTEFVRAVYVRETGTASFVPRQLARGLPREKVLHRGVLLSEMPVVENLQDLFNHLADRLREPAVAELFPSASTLFMIGCAALSMRQDGLSLEEVGEMLMAAARDGSRDNITLVIAQPEYLS